MLLRLTKLGLFHVKYVMRMIHIYLLVEYLYVESMALLALLSILLPLSRLLVLYVPVCVKAESTLGALRSSTAERRLIKHRVSVTP